MRKKEKESLVLPIELIREADSDFKPLLIPLRKCDIPDCSKHATVSHQVAGITLNLCSEHDTGTIDSGILVEIKKKKEEMKRIERRGRRN